MKARRIISASAVDAFTYLLIEARIMDQSDLFWIDAAHIILRIS